MPITFIRKTRKVAPYDRPSKPAAIYLLDGEQVTLTEAAIKLDVGVLTVRRHLIGKRIDVAAIRSLVTVQPPSREPEPEQSVKPAKPKKTPRLYTHDGRTMTLRQWADEAGITVTTLYQRTQTMSFGKALSKPLVTASADSRRRNQNRRVIRRIAYAFHEARP